MRYGAWFVILSFFLSSALVSPALAQQGVITGQVNDQQGSPIGFVQVIVQDTNLGAVADRQGRYTIQGVPAGSHQVEAQFLGYRSSVASIDVAPGETVTQNFALARDYLGMETIVATAQREPRLKLESSVAITTLDERSIEREAPRSTADMLKAVPGFYVESSGGEVGGNLFARGLPADGSFRYVSLMEDGMPVYDSTELFFVNADIFVRIDENIEEIEAVRGGSAALFSSNAPGGLVNFISKTGGPDHSGILKFGGGQDGLFRVGGNVNGPLGETGWRYSVGGFFRSDDGTRDPGFTASEGGQIKANVTREFDRGFIRIYGKYLDDSNIFFLPLPLQNPPDPEFVPGFPEDGTMTSVEGAGKVVPLPRGQGSLALPLDDGQKQDGGSILVDFGYDVAEGWAIENTFRWMDIDHSWNALLPFELVDADDWAQGFVDETLDGTDFRLMFTESGASFDSPNGLLSLGGQWLVEKPLSNVSDQFLIRKTTDRHSFTIGTYLGHYEADNTWFFNDVVTEVANAPRFVDLEILGPGGQVVRRVTNEGFRQYLPFFVNGTGDVDVYSFFAGDVIAVTEAVDVDVGVRFEHNDFTQENELTDTFDVPGGTDAHTDLNFGTGQFETVEDEFDEWALSVGVNLRQNENVAWFGRGTRGYKMPILDQFLFSGTDPDLEAEEVIQFEGGLKVASPKIGLSAVAYWLSLQDFPIQDAQVDPETGETEFVTVFAGEAVTIGSEVEIVAAPVPELRLNGTFTLQRPEFEELTITEDDQLVSLEGNQVRRIPEAIAEVGAEFEVGNFTVHGDWNFVGERFSNNQNTITLDSYNLFDVGADYRLPLYGVTFSVDVRNVGDTIAEALTEGNPRIDESLGAQQSLFLARPVLPRRVTAGVKYEF